MMSTAGPVLYMLLYFSLQSSTFISITQQNIIPLLPLPDTSQRQLLQWWGELHTVQADLNVGVQPSKHVILHCVCSRTTNIQCKVLLVHKQVTPQIEPQIDNGPSQPLSAAYCSSAVNGSPKLLVHTTQGCSTTTKFPQISIHDDLAIQTAIGNENKLRRYSKLRILKEKPIYCVQLQ